MEQQRADLGRCGGGARSSRQGRASRDSRDGGADGDASPIAKILLSLGSSIERLAKQNHGGRLGGRRPSFLASAPTEGLAMPGDGASMAAVAAAADRSSNAEEVRWSEAVDHLRVMLSSETEAVRLRSATTLSVLAECSRRAKAEILKTPEVMDQLIVIMTQGGLEAINAISVLTTDSPLACDQARDAGAIAHLAGFIVGEEGDSDDQGGDGEDEGGSSNNSSMHGGVGGSSGAAAARDSSGSSGSGADGSSSGSGNDNGSGGAGKRFRVPVTTKAEVVTALRNIATSSSRNREAITTGDQAVIPQLVKLMTKQTMETADDGSHFSAIAASAQIDAEEEEAAERELRGPRPRRGSTADGRGRRGSIVDGVRKNPNSPEVMAAKRLAEAQRKLAESAGQMLFTLIQDGGAAVKRIIISAIIEKVQEPNTVPPEEVPDLMTILRSAAEEQLAMVQAGTDAQALASALEFGRWIKVPAGMLAGARNVFKAAQDEREKERQNQLRRAALGFTTANYWAAGHVSPDAVGSPSSREAGGAGTGAGAGGPAGGGAPAASAFKAGKKLKGATKKLKHGKPRQQGSQLQRAAEATSTPGPTGASAPAGL